MLKVLKILFPLSFPTGKIWKSILLYLAVYVVGSLMQGVIVYLTAFDRTGYLVGFFSQVYTFVGLFLLCLDHLNLINKNKMD